MCSLCPCVCLFCVYPPQSRKGRSCSSQREVTVVLPNGQYVVVRCDIKSRARDVFDMVVAHANLVEHFYFSLAFLDGKDKQDPDQSSHHLWEGIRRNVSVFVFLNLDFCTLTDVSSLFLQMMSISFWITKRKFPKLRLTVGRKGRCPLFWSFFGSNILWMISPSFCKHCTSVYFSRDCSAERFLAVFV